MARPIGAFEQEVVLLKSNVKVSRWTNPWVDAQHERAGRRMRVVSPKQKAPSKFETTWKPTL
jgi:hypothetical protein